MLVGIGHGGCRVLSDELGGINAVHGAGGVVARHAGLLAERLDGLEMQVCQVVAIGGADGADLLPTCHQLAGAHLACIQVGIKGLNDFVAAGQAVGNDNDVAPALVGLAAVGHKAACCGIDWLAQVGVLTADSIEVLPGVVAAALLILRKKEEECDE